MAWYERDFSDTFGTELQPLGSGVVWSNLGYSPTCEQSNLTKKLISIIELGPEGIPGSELGSMVDTWGCMKVERPRIHHGPHRMAIWGAVCTTFQQTHISLSTPGWSLKWFKEGEWRPLSQFLHESCNFFSTVYHVGFTTGSSQSLVWVGLAWARSSLP